MLAVDTGMCAGSGKIVVDTTRPRGPVDPRIFGQNLLGYDPKTYEKWAKSYNGFSDFGEGLWDPKSGKPMPRVMELLKDSGAGALRFPGGCGAHFYDWKKAVGKGRRHFRFGIDEFLQVAADVGAEPVITLSYFRGNPESSADLIEYLNAPNDGRNPNGGKDWAAERAANGHAAPYRVRYVEVGNEVWHGNHHTIKKVSPEDYADRYLKYYAAVKAVDPAVQVGIILNDEDWNSRVLRVIGDHVDFAVLHFYFSAGWASRSLVGEDPSAVFFQTLNEPPAYRERLRHVRAMLKGSAGKPVPLAVTEYNTAFTQDEPVPYRHALGAALVNAEVLKLLMDPDSGVFMANYWDFNSRFWGLVNAFVDVNQRNLGARYVKRPNYYVYMLYHRHFGPTLVPVRQQGAETGNLSVNASQSADGKTVYLMVVNRSMTRPVTCRLQIAGDGTVTGGRAWVLNGPDVAVNNEVKHDQVWVAQHDLVRAAPAVQYTFEPHSLTAVELYRN